MIAVIFEVWPKNDYLNEYLNTPMELKATLESIPGFISVERFQSLAEEGKLLSVSFFESEEAVHAWRNTLEHRKAQALGRNRYFADYRLRVAEVIRDYGKAARDQAPTDSRERHG